MKKLINSIFIFLMTGFFCTNIVAQDLVTKQSELPCLNKKFTIVAHLVANEQGETNIEVDSIMAALDTLNKDFSPICVEFEICQFDTIDNFQYDEIENNEWDEMQTVYHQQRRINLFFVNSFEGQDTTYCGFATQYGLANLENGGIVILKDCNSPMTRALSHQMGHYFGLFNTHGPDGLTETQELKDGSNADITGDFITDTGADPFVLGDSPDQYVNTELDCRFISMKRDGANEFFQPDVGNIMSFYQAECKCSFTFGQLAQMAANCEAAMGMW